MVVEVDPSLLEEPEVSLERVRLRKKPRTLGSLAVKTSRRRKPCREEVMVNRYWNTTRAPSMAKKANTQLSPAETTDKRSSMRQQGGTGEDGHIRLADWTLSVAAIEKIKNA